MALSATLIATTYIVILLLLALVCSHRLLLAYLAIRHGREQTTAPSVDFASLDHAPEVLVQLPLFNEASVAERLINAVAAFDYPHEKLTIQVLDDSTDETKNLVEDLVARLKANTSLNIHYIHRTDRSGYKAGALANGLEQDTSELVAIFDSDFIPPRDFLKQMVPYFADQDVGLAQARWEHLNRRQSLLCQIQALLLDGHFRTEQLARSASGRFFNFNGTAGIWRRAAIDCAGSWQADTLTEDLDLSLRSQLTGWRFVYVDHVAAPSELPNTLAGFRSQQYRWVKGAGQNFSKLIRLIWSAPSVPLKARVEATSQLLLNVSYVFVVLLCILSLPLATLRPQMETAMPIKIAHLLLMTYATCSIFVFYLVSQLKNGPLAWLRTLFLTPFVFVIGIGLSVHNSIAYLVGLAGHQSEFVRTPKHGDERKVYAVKKETFVPMIEFGLGSYVLYAAMFAWISDQPTSAAFMFLEAFSLITFGFLTLSNLRLSRSASIDSQLNAESTKETALPEDATPEPVVEQKAVSASI